MGMSVKWLNDDKKIINLQIEGRWNWSELYDNVETISGMVKSVKNQVSIIVEFADKWSTILPHNVFTNASTLLQAVPANQIIVIVSKFSVIKTTVSTLKRTVNMTKMKNMIVVDTCQEAYEILNGEVK